MGLAEHAATPYLGMVLASTAQVGLIIISKSALASGMTNYTFVAYSNALAALILLPLSLLVHRSSNRPPLTFLILCGFFSLGVLGCLAQLTGYTGISYTSAEFASALLNLIPGFTFVLAVVFRMEVLNCRNSSFLAKTLGTVVSISGAFVVTLYKGPEILTYLSSPKLHYEYIGVVAAQSSWIIGGLFLAADCVVSSAYIIVQASILKKYPAELIIVFFYCFFAAILSTSVSLITDRDLSAWSLQPNIRLIAVLYSGVFGSAFQVSVAAWCLHKKGPLFVAMFHPLGIVISAVLGVIFLGDILYLGSLLGSIIIVIGFYSVMWGKAKDLKVIDNNTTNSEKAPLLPIENERTTSIDGS
ncbi:WAT1-related protein At3g28050-like [Salvia hispanica]|uniref:WAT1-related protein At3g28050-like n=1 Tax=Salvia hispanica TaxID=49212 RepID=UPI0020095342|nr:WAT1-related protein At3g28050-like [Salvia hispanica]XP_047975216.1 WAT1-related protein At3g28050-like [Salvia hispanica]